MKGMNMKIIQAIMLISVLTAVVADGGEYPPKGYRKVPTQYKKVPTAWKRVPTIPPAITVWKEKKPQPEPPLMRVIRSPNVIEQESKEERVLTEYKWVPTAWEVIPTIPPAITVLEKETPEQEPKTPPLMKVMPLKSK